VCRTVRLLVAVTAWWAAPLLRAQFDFQLEGHPIQIHSFASQGFAYSGSNNYLTMKTSQGSFAMTDIGVNASIQLSDRLRVGAQVYDRNIGNLGAWHPQLDWAVADYRWKDWLSIRGGVVKTVFGLYNDTQDVESLQTFALLPQSVYPTDLRDALLRHRGGDVYGEIPLGHAGRVSYAAYAGIRQDSRYGGYPYLIAAGGGHITSLGGLQVGGDLRWSTPLAGLLIGVSHVGADVTGTGTWTFAIPGAPPVTEPYEEHSKRDWTNQFYAQYTAGPWRIEGEYRRYWRDQALFSDTAEIRTDQRSWYVAAARRISKRLELGAYYSRWTAAWIDDYLPMPADPSSPDRHQFDKVVTARVDLNKHWNVKVEGHFLDGTGGLFAAPLGFYTQDNPQGVRPKTNLLIVRTGWTY